VQQTQHALLDGYVQSNADRLVAQFLLRRPRAQRRNAAGDRAGAGDALADHFLKSAIRLVARLCRTFSRISRRSVCGPGSSVARRFPCWLRVRTESALKLQGSEWTCEASRGACATQAAVHGEKRQAWSRHRFGTRRIRFGADLPFVRCAAPQPAARSRCDADTRQVVSPLCRDFGLDRYGFPCGWICRICGNGIVVLRLLSYVSLRR
jgi:hypothetical protein